MHKGKIVPFMFIVAEAVSVVIRGLDTCEKLKLMKRIIAITKDNSGIRQEALPNLALFKLRYLIYKL